MSRENCRGSGKQNCRRTEKLHIVAIRVEAVESSGSCLVSELKKRYNMKLDEFLGKEKNSMAGLGTLINIAAIIAGGLIGLLGGKLISSRFQETLISAIGVCVLFVGIGGAVQEMMTVSGGKLASGGTMMVIVSFAAGSLIGEWIDLEKRIVQFGEWLKQKTGNSREKMFVDGFVTASLTVCIGAMAVVGAIQDGIAGDHSTLVLKAILDMLIICVMTASMGKGCIFSAIPVGIIQGVITLLARLIQPLMTEQALSNLSLTGSMLIFCVGVNLIWENKLKVANMFQTIVIAVVCAFIGLN